MKTLIPILSIIILSILLFSCKKTENHIEEISYSDFGEPIELTCENVVLKDSILSPFKIKLIDSLLFTIDVNTKYFVHVYNLNSGSMISENILLGNGPGEMISADFCPTFNSDLCLLELDKKEIRKYSIADFLSKKNPTPSSTIKLSKLSDAVSILSTNRIVGADPFNAKNKFNFFDAKGVLIETKGEYFSYKTDYTDQEIIRGFEFKYTTNFKNRIFLTHLNADIIEIYDLKGNLLKRIQGPDIFFPNVKERRIGNATIVGPQKGSRDAYNGLKSGGNEVFVLYSGREVGNSETIFDQLLVFNWDGKPLRRYKLNHSTPFIEVDPKNRIIYGIVTSPDNHLVKYKY